MQVDPEKARLPDILDAQDYNPLLKKLWQRSQSDEIIGSCEECRGMLDIYLDAELANEDVQTSYPEIWAHLQRCAICSAHYRRLVSTVKESRAGTLPLYTPVGSMRLPFLSSTESNTPKTDASLTNAPWRLWIQSWLTGEALRLHFVLSPYYLHNWQVQTQPLASRGGEQSTYRSGTLSRSLLLQTIPIGTQRIVVELKAYPLADRPGYIKLVASVDSNEALPPNLRLRLVWGTGTVIQRLSKTGQVNLGDFSINAPAQSLQTNSGTFELFIEPTR